MLTHRKPVEIEHKVINEIYIRDLGSRMNEVDGFVYLERPDDMPNNKDKEFDQSDQNNKGHRNLYLLPHFSLRLIEITCYKSPY